jgi:hypothetical protein
LFHEHLLNGKQAKVFSVGHDDNVFINRLLQTGKSAAHDIGERSSGINTQIVRLHQITNGSPLIQSIAKLHRELIGDLSSIQHSQNDSVLDDGKRLRLIDLEQSWKGGAEFCGRDRRNRDAQDSNSWLVVLAEVVWGADRGAQGSLLTVGGRFMLRDRVHFNLSSHVCEWVLSMTLIPTVKTSSSMTGALRCRKASVPVDMKKR